MKRFPSLVEHISAWEEGNSKWTTRDEVSSTMNGERVYMLKGIPSRCLQHAHRKLSNMKSMLSGRSSHITTSSSIQVPARTNLIRKQVSEDNIDRGEIFAKRGRNCQEFIVIYVNLRDSWLCRCFGITCKSRSTFRGIQLTKNLA